MDSIDPTSHPRLAEFVGSLSLVLWIFLYLIPIYFNFILQSGEGLSLAFLAIWLLGDSTNLLGSVGQQLLPTMILLALYYTMCDFVLIGQVLYYRRKRSRHPELFDASAPTETEPLLSAITPTESTAKPKRVMIYIGGGIAIVALVVGLWVLSGGDRGSRPEEVYDSTSQILGWCSASLYLGSRVPQIAKNKKTKCVGLSLMMFAFAVAGNATYVASILLQSRSTEHLKINAAWLVGSAGTIFLDFIVLSQFHWYSKARRAEAAATKLDLAP